MFPEPQRVGGKSVQFYVNYSHQVTITFNINQLLFNVFFISKYLQLYLYIIYIIIVKTLPAKLSGKT